MAIVESYGTYTLESMSDGTYRVGGTTIKDMGGSSWTGGPIIAADTYNGVNAVVFGIGGGSSSSSYHVWYTDGSWTKSYTGPGGQNTVNLTPQEVVSAFGNVIAGYTAPTATTVESYGTYTLESMSDGTYWVGGTTIKDMGGSSWTGGPIIAADTYNGVNAVVFGVGGGSSSSSYYVWYTNGSWTNSYTGPIGVSSVRLTPQEVVSAFGNVIAGYTAPTATTVESYGTYTLESMSDGTYRVGGTTIKDMGGSSWTGGPIIAADTYNGVNAVVFGVGGGSSSSSYHVWYTDGSWTKSYTGPGGQNTVNLTPQEVVSAFGSVIAGYTAPAAPTVTATVESYGTYTLESMSDGTYRAGGTTIKDIGGGSWTGGPIIAAETYNGVNAVVFGGASSSPSYHIWYTNSSWTKINMSPVGNYPVSLTPQEVVSAFGNVIAGYTAPTATTVESYGTYTLESMSDGTYWVGGTTIKDADGVSWTKGRIIAADTYNDVRAVLFNKTPSGGGPTPYMVWYTDSSWTKSNTGPSGSYTAELTAQEAVNAFGSVISGYTPETSNEAPTAINLSSSNIAEKSNGAVVGTLNVSDPDTDDAHTLTLSGYHGGLFEVSNNQLKLRSGVSADYEAQSSYSVTVTATDSGGLSKSQAFTIGVTNQNSAPTAISLSSSSIAEKSNGAVVGTLSVTDPDTDDAHTLTLSGYHGGLFEVSNNQLKLRSGVSADYEAQSSYSVTVTATDSGGLSKSQAFTIGVTNQNSAPTAISLSSSSIAEKSNGAVVGTLSVTDPDTDDAHTLTLSGYHGGLFEVSNNQLKLRSGVSADYEAQSSYSVTVTATDSGGLSKSQDFTLAVTNKNSAPTAITLDSTTVAENSVGSHIANISDVDPDQDDLTYSITGGSDASSFEIVNDMLHLAAGVSADYETQSSYSVTLTATDSEGLTYTKDFTISITDVEEASTLYGTSGDDILDGFTGFDIIDGDDGLDTVKYSVASTEVSFSENDAGQLVIQNSANTALYTGKNASAVESDTLISMERIQFSDKNYALDLDGNAGVAAKAVITCFGQDSLDLYMSSALTLADGGSTLDEICELVASMGYIESIKGLSTNSSFVDFIFENVVGRPPNFLESSMYTAYLDDGVYTKGSLLTLAANTSLVDKLLTESAVDLIGVAGSADGEILALQYDLGLG